MQSGSLKKVFLTERLRHQLEEEQSGLFQGVLADLNNIMVYSQELHQRAITHVVVLSASLLPTAQLFPDRPTPPMLPIVLDDWQPALEAFLLKAQPCSSMRRLQGTLSDKEGAQLNRFFCVNEVVISRGSFTGVLKLDLYANSYFMTTLICDGLAISTA